jgi:hypothetical protein
MSIRIQLLLLGLVIMAYLGVRWWMLVRKDALPKTSTSNAYERIEPGIPAGQGEPEVALSDFSDAQILALAAMPALPIATADRRPVLNQQIDCIAMLDIDEPCSGDLVIGLLPATRRIGSKTWIVEGFNLATDAWEPVMAGQMYRYFQAGIQLVNRHGALNDVEFSEFVAKASNLAESLGASTEFPEMLAEVARAEQLGGFTRGHDILLTLGVHAKRAAWSYPYLLQGVRAAGFVAGAIPGRWVLSNNRLDMIALTIDAQLAMADDLEALPIRQLSLVLDVPQVPRLVVGANGDVKAPFDVMCDVAIKLCASMEASIVDEQGCAVDLQALQRTATELESAYDRLDEVGLSAGSALAKRLFS